MLHRWGVRLREFEGACKGGKGGGWVWKCGKHKWQGQGTSRGWGSQLVP